MYSHFKQLKSCSVEKGLGMVKSNFDLLEHQPSPRCSQNHLSMLLTLDYNSFTYLPTDLVKLLHTSTKQAYINKGILKGCYALTRYYTI